MPLAASVLRLLSSGRAIVACASASLGAIVLTMACYLHRIDYSWARLRGDLDLERRDFVFAAALAVTSHLVPYLWRRRAAVAKRAKSELVFGAPRGYRAPPRSELRIVNVETVARVARLVRLRGAAWGVACGISIGLLGDHHPFCGPPYPDRCCLCCSYAWDAGLYLVLAWLVVTSHLVTSWGWAGRPLESGALRDGATASPETSGRSS